MNKPLVTFALFSYNQEGFIEEAIEGALAQDYAPLQIILSDDCSVDGTYQRMEYAARHYRGESLITLNRNEENLGIGGHINRVMQLAKGELIVAAAGDDVSFPDRTPVLVNRWLESKKTAMSLISGATRVDPEGHPVDYYEPPITEPISGIGHLLNGFYFLGATHAWSRRVFDTFGPLKAEVTHEDQAIAFRSLLLGSIAPESRPLLAHRTGVGISRNYATRDVKERLYGEGLEAQKRFLVDKLQWLEDGAKYGLEESSMREIRKLKLESEFRICLGNRQMPGIGMIRNLRREGTSFTWIMKMYLLYNVPVTKKIKDSLSRYSS